MELRKCVGTETVNNGWFIVGSYTVSIFLQEIMKVLKINQTEVYHSPDLYV